MRKKLISNKLRDSMIFDYKNLKLSIHDLSDKYLISKSTIRRALITKIDLRDTKESVSLSGYKISEALIGRKPYKITDEIRVKMRLSAKNRKGIKGYSLKPSGYYECTTGENKGRNVHIIIMEQYLGRKLTENEVVHHINGIKTDNRLYNLQLMTNNEHASHHAKLRVKNGTNYDISKHSEKGEKHPTSKLKESEVIDIFYDNRNYESIAFDYNVSKSCIKHIKRGRTWKHLNLK